MEEPEVDVPNQRGRTSGCGGTVTTKRPLFNLPSPNDARTSIPWGQPIAKQPSAYVQADSISKITYTLQRQSPVALRLPDTIAVSLLVLVVVGVAVIAQQRRRSAVRSPRQGHERDALLRFGHGDVGRGLEGVGLAAYRRVWALLGGDWRSMGG